MAKKQTTSELASYRSAYHNYEVSETFEAGIVLQGTEVKSLRDGGGNLRDNYIIIKNNEAWLRQVSISPYKFSSHFGHEEKRERKLLLHKQEIQKLKKLSEIKGLTLIALLFYLKNGLIKVKIGVCKGKKIYDKREVLKEKQHKREMERSLKT